MGEDTGPPALDEIDELDGYWSEDTTITVSRYTKERLNEIREGRSWDVFLEKLRREHSDPLTLNDADEIAEQIKNEISMANEPTVKVDTERLINEIEKLQQLVENVPEETAETFGSKYR